MTREPDAPLPDGPLPHDSLPHDEAWLLIPWHVADTLDPADDERLRGHLATCPACRAEVGTQTALATVMRAQNMETLSQARAWGSVRPTVEAEAGAAGDMGSGVRAPARPWWKRRRFGWIGGAAVAGVALVLAGPALDPGRYVTRTDEGTAARDDAVELRVRPAPGTDAAAVEAALRAAGAVEIAAPSGTGLIRARIPAERRAAVLDVLRADPLFLVVAADPVP